jgi:hypothetical protein
MEPSIEDKPIKPVNKLRERFEALAVSSSSNKPNASHGGSDHVEESSTTHEATNASPRLTASGLYNLRSISASSSSIPNTSNFLKKSSASDTSNDEVPTPTHEVPTPTQARTASSSVSRKSGLRAPPPPPDRSILLRTKTSADSVGSPKKPTAAGVYRKPPPPPPPPSLGSQPGHVASLSVGDLVNQINIGNNPSFRSLDAS